MPLATVTGEANRGDGSRPLEPTYLTPAQVAQLLQVSEKSVDRWPKQDASMPMLKIGKVVRFPRERLLTWLRQREQGRARPRGIGRMLTGS
jgi:excisionase family DNA binding protein